MNNHKGCIEALNDLIKINNDRIEGYQRAIAELPDGKDNDLKMTFQQMVTESQALKSELTQRVLQLGGDTAEGTTASGKLYRMWMDVKAVFTGGDRKTVLNNCEMGEDAAQNAYKMALEDDDVMEETKSLIRQQKQTLKASHDKIKMMRDAA